MWCAPYLPDAWYDDGYMTGMMSMFKSRDVNPDDYDAKMAFWTALIADSCAELQNPIFTLTTLKARFRRRNRIAVALDEVVKKMKKDGEIVALQEVLSRNSSTWFWKGFVLLRNLFSR
jgi:hypothetical protein